VLVHRPPEDVPPALDAEFRPRRLLVPLDGSPTAAAAIAPAAELAKLFGAGLRLLRVVEPIPFMGTFESDELVTELATRAGADLAQIASGLRRQDLSVETKVVLNRHTAQAILGAADHADLVVMGSHGRGRVGRFLLGSVTDKVVRGASRPVLIVRSSSPTGGSS
jgi:nucleotide-binding universal stress UspA family protein